MLHRVQMAGHHIMIWKWTRLLVQCARPTITIISRNWQSCSPEKMHLHQKDKIQSLLNVLSPQPNPEQVVVNIFRHSPLLYYFPFLTRMEGGVDDILFIRRPWSWTVATTSRLLGLDVSPTICILWLEFRQRGQVDTSTSSLEQNNSAVSALNRLLATKIVHRRLLQKSVFAPTPSIFRAAAPRLWI